LLGIVLALLFARPLLMFAWFLGWLVRRSPLGPVTSRYDLTASTVGWIEASYHESGWTHLPVVGASTTPCNRASKAAARFSFRRLAARTAAGPCNPLDFGFHMALLKPAAVVPREKIGPT
jgi:hypothetical protein